MTYSAGVNTTLGTAPSYSGLTTIVANSFWANGTFNLGGNLTFGASATLTLYNAVVSFDEPVTASWSHGIYGMAASGQFLKITHGSVVTGPAGEQTPFIQYTSGGENPISFDNSTFLLKSNKTQTVTTSYGFQVGSVNFSTINLDNITSAFYTAFAVHSRFKWGVVGIGSAQKTSIVSDWFESTAVVQTGPGINFSNDNWTGFFQVENYGSVQSVWINNSMLLDINLTRWVSGPGPSNWQINAAGQSLYLLNDSVSNAWTNSTASANQYPLIGPHDSGYSGNITVEHTTFSNLVNAHSLGAAGFVDGPGFPGETVASRLKYEFNVVHGFKEDINSGNELAPVCGLADLVNVSYNVFYNMYAPTHLPLSSQNVFSTGGVEQVLMQIGDGITNYSNANIGKKIVMFLLPHAVGTGAVGNWIINMSGQAWAPAVMGTNGHVLGETLINLNSSGGITAGLNSGAEFINATGISIYGAYNYSGAIGGTSGGGAYDDNYTSESYYDVDATSFGAWTEEGWDSWIGQSIPSLLAINENGTFDYNGTIYTQPEGTYPFHTTKVMLVNDNISNVQLMANVVNSASTRRTVLPNDFNVTVDNSYIPANLTTQAHVFSLRTGTSAYLNPSFLNLTGYLGIFAGQTYDINSSTIKSETSLPVYFGGGTTSASQVALIPQNAKDYLYTLNVTSASCIEVGVNSSAAPPVSVVLQGVPGDAYNLTVDPITSSGTIESGGSSSIVVANSTGQVVATYYPSTEPKLALFSLSYPGAISCPGCGGTIGIPNGLFSGQNLPYVLISAAAVGAILLAVVYVAGIGTGRYTDKRGRQLGRKKRP